MKILNDEIIRVRKLARTYEKLGIPGLLKLRRLLSSLEFAKNALAEKDLRKMNSAYQNLKHIE